MTSNWEHYAGRKYDYYVVTHVQVTHVAEITRIETAGCFLCTRHISDHVFNLYKSLMRKAFPRLAKRVGETCPRSQVTPNIYQKIGGACSESKPLLPCYSISLEVSDFFINTVRYFLHILFLWQMIDITCQ
jgi:hypothetical protein